jgi:hypothetical protein
MRSENEVIGESIGFALQQTVNEVESELHPGIRNRNRSRETARCY